MENFEKYKYKNLISIFFLEIKIIIINYLINIIQIKIYKWLLLINSNNKYYYY